MALQLGTEYGYREPPHTWLQELRRALLVKLGPPTSKSKVLVRWLDGEFTGLEEWVPKQRLVTTWADAPAYLEEERLQYEAVLATDEDENNPERLAAEEVLDAISMRQLPSGSHGPGTGWRPGERDLLRWDSFRESASALALDPEQWLSEPHAYVDRVGTLRAPIATAIRLARVLCERFPEPVLAAIRDREDEMRRRVVEDRYEPDLPSEVRLRYRLLTAQEELSKYEPVFQLVRLWCGDDTSSQFDRVRELQAEATRLREVIRSYAIRALRAGRRDDARSLLAEIGEALPRKKAELDALMGWPAPATAQLPNETDPTPPRYRPWTRCP